MGGALFGGGLMEWQTLQFLSKTAFPSGIFVEHSAEAGASIRVESTMSNRFILIGLLIVNQPSSISLVLKGKDFSLCRTIFPHSRVIFRIFGILFGKVRLTFSIPGDETSEKHNCACSGVSSNLVKAVLIAEDNKFWQHRGFDYEAIEMAIEKNIEAREFKSGASTISQQLAKNLYLSPSKNPVRKIKEAILTWRIEKTLSKRRILELYVNVAEWGDGIFGVEQAARTYYGVSAAGISPQQAARLAGVPDYLIRKAASADSTASGAAEQPDPVSGIESSVGQPEGAADDAGSGTSNP